MRSLVVTTWFPDHENPSRTPFCLEHVHALQSAGHDVSVVHVQMGRIRRKPMTETYEHVETTRVWLEVRSPLSYIRVTLLLIGRLRTAEILHTMAFSTVLLASVAWMVRRRPWVHTEHWNGVSEPASVGPAWARLAFLRICLKLPHAVTAVTNQLARSMLRFCRRDAVHVVPCVVDPVEVSSYPPPSPLRVIGIGLIIDRKNPILAVETVAALVQQGVDVSYTWVGEGPLRDQVMTRVDELGLAGRVQFIGSVPPDRVPSLIQDAHLFFVPSAQENFFTAAAEAIVAGRPAVIPLSGGFDDYCTPDNSVVVHDWEIDTLAQGIITAQARFLDKAPWDVARTIGDRFSRREVGVQFTRIYDAVV